MFKNMIYGKSLNVLTEYQICIYQFAVVDLGVGPGTLPPLFWVGSVEIGRHNFEHNAIYYIKVSGIASGNKLIKTIRYPHM